MISVKNVSKKFGRGNTTLKALDDVSFNVEDGEFLVILGQSGSGKSTILNLIGCIDSVTLGTIIVDGVDVTKMSSKQLCEYRNKNIGFVFQSFYLEPAYSVVDNVVLPLTISNAKKQIKEAKSKELLEKLNLTEKAHAKTSTLSGGQKQRVAIARALVNDPKIILADEPTGNLDSNSGAEVIKILQQICKSGKTVIMVTHNEEQAKVADHIIRLKDGKIYYDNTETGDIKL
ncbi:MAG: ABC transporter ATP-binding protein [Clostridia bacterium]|nr:ABC transporter ATP-binding protein [Clostridia bacterium]